MSAKKNNQQEKGVGCKGGKCLSARVCWCRHLQCGDDIVDDEESDSDNE